jgi:hypothetical protein
MVGSLLWWWGRSTVELLLLWSTQLTPRWGIHHVVLGRSSAITTTASGSRHHSLSPFLIGLSNSLHHPLLVDGCTCQLVVQQAREMHQALLQMDGEPCTVHVGLLFASIDVVYAMLSQGVELPRVVEYTMVP